MAENYKMKYSGAVMDHVCQLEEVHSEREKNEANTVKNSRDG